MFLILSNIPFQELIKKPDMKEYVCNCDYFGLVGESSKKKIIEWIDGWVPWYSLFHTEPLYLTVISDKDWYPVSGKLQNSIRITTWRHTPQNATEAKNYPFVPEEKRIVKESDMPIICENFRKHNLKNGIFELCLQ